MPWNDVLRLTPNAMVSLLYTHKLLFYVMGSFVAVMVTIANALKRHSNFYSLAIYLSKSNRSVLILANFSLLIALSCGRAAQRIFFGPLRTQEVERLHDRLWIFVTESLLAFTIFRDDFDGPFVLMFGFLLFVKSFHWLSSDRIEWMDQRPYPGPPILFHIRVASLLFLLWLIDISMFAFAVESTTKNGVGGTMMFASEYAILMASALNITAKYMISINDLRRAQRRGGENAPPWQNKSMWVFYVELVTDFLKLTTYLVFFMLIVAFYGLPLNIIRDVYLTGRSFITRLRALFRYRAATRNMDERYPNATEQELLTMSDRTCIICREELHVHNASSTNVQSTAHSVYDGPNTTPKKLPCGHIFHFYCLRSWLERQQSCPTCRRSVLDTAAHDQNRPQQAAPPQPQAVPPRPNGFRAPGAQPLHGEHNPLVGLLGRLARNAAQPPLAFARNPPGQQGPGTQGWLPGQTPGVVIQYNIQYQHGPRQQEQTLLAGSTSTPLQPVPPFAGFVGPNENWRPWVLNGEQGVPRASTSETSSGAGQPAHGPSIVKPGSSQEPSSSRSGTTRPPFLPSLIPLDPEHIPSSSTQTNYTSLLSSPPHSLQRSTTSPTDTMGVISDSQLAVLDRNTREAIDERLRILQNISTVTEGLVQDLVRVRSALSPPMSFTVPQETSLHDLSSQELNSSVAERGDEVVENQNLA